MVTEVEVRTGLVVTVKVVLVAPAGTVTPLAGTLADGSLLEREGGHRESCTRSSRRNGHPIGRNTR